MTEVRSEDAEVKAAAVTETDARVFGIELIRSTQAWSKGFPGILDVAVQLYGP